jgi:hypothetical protein
MAIFMAVMWYLQQFYLLKTATLQQVFCMSKPPTLGSLEMLFLSLAPGRS